MSEPAFEPEVPASAYGRQRREQWLAGLQANADMAKSAELAAYGQSKERRETQAGQAGLYQHMSPYDRGAVVAGQQAVVGSAYGGRPLERLGGTFDHGDVGCSPAPARVDLTRVDQQGRQPGHSPLWAYMNGGRD